MDDQCPCKVCTSERHPACHDDCPRYRRWSREQDRIKANRERYKKPIFDWRKKWRKMET